MVRRVLSAALSVSLIAAFVFVFRVKSAYAYIDLGTGSYMLQMLLATLLASLFMIKVYWQRFTSRITRIFAKFKATNVRVK